MVRRLAGCCVFFSLAAVSCSGSEEPPVGKVSSALSGAANVSLGVLTNSCGANQAQDFFEVKNNGTNPVTVSDLSIKFWVYDTSAANIVPIISTGGCLSNGSGCFHQVSGVTATATRVAPACGTDPNHQASWEITVSSTDHTPLPAGARWTNLQTTLSLSNFASFVPGTSKWYSPCLSGAQYAPDEHFAVYHQGALVPSSGIAAPSCRAPHGTQQLAGHVPPAISNAPFVGFVPQDTVVQLSLGLPARGISALKTLASSVADPTSPSYRQYLTVDEFATQFGPTTTDYQSVVSWAQAHGLTVTKTYPNRLQVNVSGTAADVERALYVNLVQRARPDGTRFYAPDREPSLDLPTTVDFVEHLNDYFVMKPQAGSGSGGNYLGRDFRNAYASCASSTLNGAGQIIGLVGGDGFSLADVTQYASQAGISPVPTVTAVHSDPTYQACQVRPVFCGDGSQCTGTCADGTACFTACPVNSQCMTSGSICPQPGGFLEMSLDIQMAMSMAPGAQIRVYQGAFALPDMTTILPLARQISTSWGMGPITPMMAKAFLAFAVQGQSFSGASGDAGRIVDEAAGNVAPAWSDIDGITMVGGTRLSMNGAGVSYAGEVVWPNSGGWFADGGGTGPSTPIPGYQAGINMTAVGGSNTLRNVPDIALVAESVQVVIGGVTAGGIWGTSVASPLWAGFMALVNQQAANIGRPPVGFANPALYAISKVPAQYAAGFNDILPPGNSGGLSGGFNAFPGYDLATGLGSPKCALIDALSRAGTATSPVASVAGGVEHTCARRASGALYCWGDDSSGELGDGKPNFRQTTPVPVTSIANASSVATGAFHTCVVTSGGGVSCWGFSSFGQLGSAVPVGTQQTTPVAVPGLSGVTAVAAGSEHTCALLSNGTVSCWGANSFGQLGDGTTTFRSTPQVIAGLTGVTALGSGAGYHHTCVVRTGGNIRCWGSNADGELGTGTASPQQTTPVSVVGVTGAVAVATGGGGGREHTCALLSGGTVSCWGSNVFGELGIGNVSTDPRPNPTAVPGLTGVTGIACGESSSCALLGNGTMRCWGNNADAQLGNGDTSGAIQTSPVAVTGLTNVVGIGLGFRHGCAVRSDGRLWCWGGNFAGSVGDGTSTDQGVDNRRYSPVQVL
jgi:alpha-tubulin suppressor-like RCC1 family protein